MLTRFRSRSADQRGQVLAIVAILMTVFLALVALAVDIGSYDQAQRQVQSAADAGALAASQDLSSSAATAAAGDGTTYALKNFPGATVNVTTNASTATVSVTASTPTFFGKFLGLTKENVSATAVAAKTGGATTQCSPGATCDAIFAMDSSCSTYDINFSGGGSTITGGVQTNGSVESGGGGSSFLGPSIYGNGSGCNWNNSGGGNTFASPTVAQAPTTIWPINYATDFPSCTGSGCTGPCDVTTTPCPAGDSTPSFCTTATNAASETLDSYYPYTLTSGNIYCDVGGGTAATPTTWNGAITANQSGTAIESSFVAGSVTVGGGSSLTACGYSTSGYAASGCNSTVPPTTYNYPLIYAVDIGGTPINIPGGGGTFLGDLFAPNGTISFGGGGDTTTFLEGQQVVYVGGGLTGDGPSDNGTGSTSSSGSESLIQ